MKFERILLCLAGAALLTGVAANSGFGEQNLGADQIVISGGSTGVVPFAHRQHQDTLKDCNLCHSVFPQEAGAIDTLKAQGQLKKKQVMNKQCIKCHKEKKRAGEESGPTTCKTCHIKS